MHGAEIRRPEPVVATSLFISDSAGLLVARPQGVVINSEVDFRVRRSSVVSMVETGGARFNATNFGWEATPATRWTKPASQLQIPPEDLRLGVILSVGHVLSFRGSNGGYAEARQALEIRQVGRDAFRVRSGNPDATFYAGSWQRMSFEVLTRAADFGL